MADRFRHLKPGYGHFEQVDIDLQPRCDDDVLPLHAYVQWYKWLEDATHRANRSIAYQENTKQLLEAQGFVDVRVQVIKLPVNPWPADPHLKQVGRWCNLGLTEGLEAVSLGPLTRVYKWSAEDVRKLLEEVKTAMCSKKYRIYNNL